MRDLRDVEPAAGHQLLREVLQGRPGDVHEGSDLERRLGGLPEALRAEDPLDPLEGVEARGLGLEQREGCEADGLGNVADDAYGHNGPREGQDGEESAIERVAETLKRQALIRAGGGVLNS